MRLRNYKLYSATFEPCEVQGSKTGYKAIVHTSDMDLVTYGVNLENTIKMAKSVITDMAHVMSFEELIPESLSAAVTSSSQENTIEQETMHEDDSALRQESKQLSATESCAFNSSRNHKALARAPMPHGSGQSLAKAAMTPDCGQGLARDPMLHGSGQSLAKAAIVPDCGQSMTNSHDLAEGQKLINEDNSDQDKDSDALLRSLVRLMSDDCKSQDLAEPTYVKALSKEQLSINHNHSFNIDIELPTQTAIKIAIANHLTKHHENLNSLASTIGCKREELERQLDFYQDTSIYDLKLILSCIDLKLVDIDEV